ncbi:MAG: hypothetical protein IJR83_04490 [Clostridia bacterium]|nr:hypothetical protein [Clostridia bacterium]
MRILDCHLNFGATNNGEPYRNCDTFEELLAELDRSGIEGGLIRCGYSNTVGVNYGNRFLAEKLAETGKENLFGVWAALPPFTNETPKPEQLPGLMKENRIGALYLAPQAHRFVVDRLTLSGLLGVCCEAKIPVILNTSCGVSMEQIYQILSWFPGLTAVVGDKDAWPNARKLYPLAYTYERVYLDLSYVMDAGGIEDMTGRFGAGKLLFGTAFPERYTGSMLAVTRTAAISDADREMIFGKNLERLIGEAELV